ncbi:MotA/TolQ/ExbB proton channel family protein [Pseudomonas lopnurensis]|uniref:MotA/TolQ/ExbB proton channel family protein n=1 Tax=Pseudomonas lopnurensis TaxID=1477517 RepID=UPI00187AEBFF|nr:MotA/TolQ/ExbB proton channel family protein [Pseudomonas lopnurensis]MBE7374364.1 MotA/TolQ/ExbB proton channel family protein [Pseudomonas lopnurensis]
MLEAVIQYSKDSWGIIPLMLVIFIIGIAVIIERYFFFRKSIKSGASLDADLKHVAQGNLEDAKKVAEHYGRTAQGKLVTAALAASGKTEAALEREVDETIMVQVPYLDRNLWVLDTCVTLGPLLGLLGTIIHMIQVFSVLATNSSQQVSSVTGPIAHALVATAVGLCIAITCVVFLNYFNKRIRLVVNQMELIKSMLVSRFATF